MILKYCFVHVLAGDVVLFIVAICKIFIMILLSSLVLFYYVLLFHTNTSNSALIFTGDYWRSQWDYRVTSSS